jgi:hypothetical protein
MNTIGNLAAGEGYYLKVNFNSSITLTEPVLKTIIKTEEKIPPEYFDPVQGNLVYNPMNFIIILKKTGSNIITKGDELAVYDGVFCVGAATVTDNDADYITVVASMKDNPDMINGYKAGNSFGFKFWDKETGELYSNVIPNPQNSVKTFVPLETYVGELSTDALGVKEENLKNDLLNVLIAPNPIMDKLKVYYHLIEDASVEVAIFDVSGRTVYNSNIGNKYKGSHAEMISAENLLKGVYVLRLQATDNNGQAGIVQKRFVKIK